MAAIVYAGKVLRDLGVPLPFTYLGGAASRRGLRRAVLAVPDREKGCGRTAWSSPSRTVARSTGEYRGRMEIAVSVAGVSAHGSAPERGVNAIYRMADILKELEALNERLAPHAFLGQGARGVGIRSTSPSLCAVADSAASHVDRRLTAGETRESAVAEIEPCPRSPGTAPRSRC